MSGPCSDHAGAKLTLRDERQAGTNLDVHFQGELRVDQQRAADAMLRHDTGVLAATTAFGKTVIAAWLIARRGVNTLVLVHRRQLMDQWVERSVDVPRRPVEGDRPDWRRARSRHGATRCRHHPEPGPKGRR